MKAIEGQVAVRLALKPVFADDSATAMTGEIIDTQGFTSLSFVFFPSTLGSAQTEDIKVDALIVNESDASNMGSPTTIFTLGTSPNIRGDATTLIDADPCKTANKQPIVFSITDLTRRKRYMQASAIIDRNTILVGECFLFDPLESMHTDAEICQANGEAVYIGGAQQ